MKIHRYLPDATCPNCGTGYTGSISDHECRPRNQRTIERERKHKQRERKESEESRSAVDRLNEGLRIFEDYGR